MNLFFVNKIKLSINRLDLCTDLSQDIMMLLTHNIQSGKVYTFNSHLHGIGFFDNKCFSRFIGPLLCKAKRHSCFYKKFKLKNNKDLKLETVYAGTGKSSDCTVVFYDKKLESSKRKHTNYLDQTRIEIRLFSLRDDK